MAEKRALILPADLVERIDANRGDMNRSEFITFLLESLLRDNQGKEVLPSTYVTRHDLEAFEQDMRSLLKSFLEFFITYGLEFGTSPKREDFDLLEQKLKHAVISQAKEHKQPAT